MTVPGNQKSWQV